MQTATPSYRIARQTALRSSYPELWLRLCLAGLAVAISCCFQWNSLRFLTSELNLKLDALAGVHWQRVTFDTLMWHGTLYRYENACTFIDVFFGAIPLLWRTQRNIGWNLGMVITFAGGLLLFNVVRLSISDVLFAAGISWDVAHNLISGISYFAVWMVIWRGNLADMANASD